MVVLAAGMDTRAFRLPWPAGIGMYELDRPEVLARKEAILQGIGAVARCTRHRLEVDLTSPWAQAVQDAGLTLAHRRSGWLRDSCST